MLRSRVPRAVPRHARGARVTEEEIARLTRVVVVVDDMVQRNREEYLKILRGLDYQNIASKQVVATLHLLMKFPILELMHESRPLGCDDEV